MSKLVGGWKHNREALAQGTGGRTNTRFFGTDILRLHSCMRRALANANRRWLLILAAGLVVLLSLSWLGCNGFFVNPTLSSIFITPAAATLNLNGSVSLTANANYSDGSTGTLSGSSVGWISSAPAVATVTSPGGVVTGISFGTATITATDQGVTSSTPASITVSPTNVTSLVITTTQGSLSPPSTATISGAPATLQFFAYANGSTSLDVTNAVSWSSSNTSAATISTGLSSGSGLATSVAAGSTNISATLATGSGTVTSNVIALTVQ